jgi:hypothetical protein
MGAGLFAALFPLESPSVTRRNGFSFFFVNFVTFDAALRGLRG